MNGLICYRSISRATLRQRERPELFARLVLLSLIVLAAPLRMPAQGATAEGAHSTEATAVVDTMHTMFVALGTEDLAKFHSLTVPGFYAFDNGKRYDGDALMQIIVSAHAKGMKFVWSVTQPDVHIHGNYAWIAYANVGSIQQSSTAEPTPMTWLESAFLESHNGSWKITFLQSSRVAAPPPSGAH
jgi:hypothetical protein